MRAVYVPARVMPAGAARRPPLTPAQLRGLLALWARGVRAGQGRLPVGD